jgi:hypothetical protein
MLRRLRGRLLRFVRRRVVVTVAGLALALPAAWMEFSGRFDAWWIDGAALVLGATGIALMWIGVAGVKPDYVDPDG